MILAIDPGKVNLGWCILSDKGKRLKWGLVARTYTEFKAPEDIVFGRENVHKLCERLKGHLAKLSKKNEKVTMVFERFVPRGRFNTGNLTEIVNVVIGQLITELHIDVTFPILASTWKNRRGKAYGGEPVCKTIPPHLVDAYTMGLYILEKASKIDAKDIKKKLKKVQEKDWHWKYVSKTREWVKNK